MIALLHYIVFSYFGEKIVSGFWTKCCWKYVTSFSFCWVSFVCFRW